MQLLLAWVGAVVAGASVAGRHPFRADGAVVAYLPGLGRSSLVGLRRSALSSADATAAMRRYVQIAFSAAWVELCERKYDSRPRSFTAQL